ncbi:hypothetical protein [Demequina globuliformis]|uniref:hypothetical protein n=1 Tax=Demequina globuliformis TaxID=676202 RepID=UPI0007813908|nr:hypothetical protein [Demequina globuliformis]
MSEPDPLSLSDDLAVKEFIDAVTHSAPAELMVTAIDDGFDVTYREELTQRGILMRIDSTFRAVVRCDASTRTFTMADVGVVSHSSLGGLRRSTSWTSGRMYATRTVEAWGTRDDGTIGTLDSQKQDTRVLHAAVRGPASELGWVEEQPLSAKVGKTVAIVVAVGTVLAGVVVGVLAIAGVFS